MSDSSRDLLALVVKKTCGCYIATASACFDSDPDAVISLVRDFNEEDDVTFEWKTIGWVRDGGLTFDCDHP